MVDTGKGGGSADQSIKSDREGSCVEKFPNNGMFMKRNVFFPIVPRTFLSLVILSREFECQEINNTSRINMK